MGKKTIASCQISLFDIPVSGSEDDQCVETLWWQMVNKRAHREVCTNFLSKYGVRPIFIYRDRTCTSYIKEPDNFVLVAKEGILLDKPTTNLWSLDYGKLPAERPQDISSQVVSLLEGLMTSREWSTEVNVDLKTTQDKVPSIQRVVVSEGGQFIHLWSRGESAKVRLYMSPDMHKRLIEKYPSLFVGMLI